VANRRRSRGSGTAAAADAEEDGRGQRYRQNPQRASTVEKRQVPGDQDVDLRAASAAPYR